MSYVIPAYQYEEESELVEAGEERALRFVPRSRKQWIVFLAPLMICFMSWQAGGIPTLTDLGFTILSILLGIFLCAEFFRFPVRFGIGGLVLYGGSLCWFCQDYFTNWFRHDFSNSVVDVPAWVIAKAATMHAFFIMMMCIGLNLKFGRWAEKLLLCVPDPMDTRFYLYLVLIMFAIGVSPYCIWNAEPFYMCIFHAAFGGWTGPPQMTVFRDGNLNYHWGAYVAQIIQVGQVGGIFAIMYSLMIARSWIGRIGSFLIWLFWTLGAVSSDRRGGVAFALLPPIALLFIKYQAASAARFKRFSAKSYIVCGLLTVGLLWVVQYQITFRGTGFVGADLSKVELTKNQGNTMFSEGLLAYKLIPDEVSFFRDKYPGQAALQPIPQTILDFFIGMIPRALWNNKPIDPLWEWYNRVFLHVANGTSGTTISHGMVGTWYFTYGIWGVIEGGLLVGWCMGISERALQQSEGKPIGILMSLAFATWIFRTYRDWIYIDLYGLVLGGIAMYILMIFMRPFLARPAS